MNGFARHPGANGDRRFGAGRMAERSSQSAREWRVSRVVPRRLVILFTVAACLVSTGWPIVSAADLFPISFRSRRDASNQARSDNAEAKQPTADSIRLDEEQAPKVAPADSPSRFQLPLLRKFLPGNPLSWNRLPFGSSSRAPAETPKAAARQQAIAARKTAAAADRLKGRRVDTNPSPRSSDGDITSSGSRPENDTRSADPSPAGRAKSLINKFRIPRPFVTTWRKQPGPARITSRTEKAGHGLNTPPKSRPLALGGLSGPAGRGGHPPEEEHRRKVGRFGAEATRSRLDGSESKIAENWELPLIVPAGGARQPTNTQGGTTPSETAIAPPTYQQTAIVDVDVPEDAAPIARLVEALRSSATEDRRQAATELGWYGEKARDALPSLYHVLADREPAVRIAAAAAIWEIDRQAGTVVPVLVELLHSPEPTIRTLAAYALGNIGSESKRAIPDLHRVLDASTGLFQLNMAEAILRIDNRDDKAVDVLLNALQESDADIRCQAAYGLSVASADREQDVTEALLALKNDPDPRVQSAVQLTLEEVEAARSRSDVSIASQPSEPGTPSTAVRSKTSAGPPLPHIRPAEPRDPKIAPPRVAKQSEADEGTGQVVSDGATAIPQKLQKLIDQLNSDQPLERKDAAARLAWIGPDARPALPALRKRLDDESPVVRAAAAWAVWEIDRKAEPVLPVLLEILGDEDEQLATLTTYILGSLKSSARSALPALRRKMATSDGILRLHLAEAIAKIEPADRPAVDVLIDALADGNAEVRSQAAYALSVVDADQAGRVIPELAAALADDDNRVQTTAKLTLVGFLESKKPGVRGLTAYVLSTIGPKAKAILPELQRLLASSRGFDRLQLAEAILSIDPADGASVDVLLAALTDGDPNIRCQAAYALAHVDPGAPTDTAGHQRFAGRVVGWSAERVIRRLTAALDDRDDRVRLAARTTLADLKPADDGPPPRVLDPSPRLADVDGGGNAGHGSASPQPPRFRIEDRPVASPGSVVISDVPSDPRPLPGDVVHRTPSPVVVRPSDEVPIQRPAPTVAPLLPSAQESGETTAGDAVGEDSRDGRTSVAASEPRSPAVDEESTKSVLEDREPARLSPSADGARSVGAATVASRQPVPPVPGMSRDLGADEPNTYEGRPDIFLQHQSLVEFSRPIPYDEQGVRQPLPEEVPEAVAAYQKARAAAGFSDLAIRHRMGTGRGWAPTSYYWEAAALCHRPVFFEEIEPERYGNSHGLLQPVVSTAYFFGTVPLLPYIATAAGPHECTYTLGHYRPGSDIPYRHHCLPIRLDASLVETATIWGIILLIH